MPAMWDFTCNTGCRKIPCSAEIDTVRICFGNEPVRASSVDDEALPEAFARAAVEAASQARRAEADSLLERDRPLQAPTHIGVESLLEGRHESMLESFQSPSAEPMLEPRRTEGFCQNDLNDLGALVLPPPGEEDDNDEEYVRSRSPPGSRGLPYDDTCGTDDFGNCGAAVGEASKGHLLPPGDYARATGPACDTASAVQELKSARAPLLGDASNVHHAARPEQRMKKESFERTIEPLRLFQQESPLGYPLQSGESPEEEMTRRQSEEDCKSWVDGYLRRNGYAGINSRRRKPGITSRLFRAKYPLHTAVKQRDANVVRILLWAGAELTMMNSDGLTPLELAEKTNVNGTQDEVIKMLTARDERNLKVASLGG